MKIKGYVCFMVDHPSYANEEATEAVYEGDALVVYEDENGILWYETQGRKWLYNGEYGKIYSHSDWRKVHLEETLRALS